MGTGKASTPILIDDRLENSLADFKSSFNEMEAVSEANRCINCYGAPCISACPTHIDIPRFISRIANGHVAGAAKTILDSNILGLSCARSCPTEVLCEGACVYNSLDKKPILIGKLQRYATEYAYERNLKFYKPGNPSGKRVALVGAGPASLACAHELRKYGHETVILEKSTLPGGLNTQGIAPYKMKAQTSLREIEEITHMGVTFEYGRELGRNLDLKDLTRDYDAVFLGLGLGPDSRLDTPGSQLPHVRGAVEWIAQMKTRPSAETKAALQAVKTALIVGGGNTALDACRELKGLGVPKVVVSYRRGEAEMSGYKHEFKWAKQEGVEFWFHTLPVAFDTGRATLQKTSVTPEGQVVLVEGEKMDLEATLVLVATGQSKLDRLLGELKIDRTTGRTDSTKVFAGGDLLNGGKEVVNAVAEGKAAALLIHESLASRPASPSKGATRG